MTTLIHADIFFFVTTIVVICLGILLIIAFVYIIQILRNVRDVSRAVKSESQEIIQDVHKLRQDVKEKGLKIVHIGRLVKAMLKWRKKKSEENKE